MERRKNRENLKYAVLAAVLGAMVYVLTAFLKVPTHQGYIHIGDGVIFLAAALLPAPYAMAAGALGAGLSDYLAGYPMWVLPTVIIKALTVVAFTSRKNTLVPVDGRHAKLLEQAGHQATTDENTQHGLPRGNAHP